MKKTFLLLTVALAAGVIFQGCVYLDHPYTQMADEVLPCEGVCNVENGSGLLDYAMLTGGPASFFFPKEPGEYNAVVQAIEGDEGGCIPLGAGGGGSGVVLDTYRNEAFWNSSGCPISYVCYGNIADVTWTGCFPAIPDPTGIEVCGAGNSECIPDPGNLGGPVIIDPAGTVFMELAYRSVDTQPGSPYGAGDNLKRRPGDVCPDCGTVAPTPGDDHKTLICHVPRGNPDNAHTISIDVAAVPAHLGHGDPEDSLGQGCGGTGPTGGQEVPTGDQQPDWTLGILFPYDATAWKTAGLPWTDDYSFGSANLLKEEAAQTLLNVLASNPMDDGGFASIAVTKLSANGQTVELSTPYTTDIRMTWENGRLNVLGKSEAYQDSLTEVIRFVLDNTQDGEPVDWTSISFELSSGHVIKGSTLQRALGYKVAFGHNRLAQALEQLGTLSADVPQRIDRIQTHRR